MKTSAAAEHLPASNGPGQRSPVSSAHPVTMLARVSKQLQSRWPEFATLLLYAALVAFAIPYHEPWADEAQAWQLARSLSLPALFQTYIRYEGSPGLWHLLLWILIHLHVTYAGMHWVCGGIAVGATALLVLKSPFPRYLKLLLPFTFFLLYQYAVVARSYALVPILLYCIALCWKKSPLILALLLGLLANVALHAAVISAGLAVVYLINQFRNRAAFDPRRRQLLLAAAVLLALWAFALWTAWPPKDFSTHISYIRGQSRPILLSATASLLWAASSWWLLSIAFWIAIALCLRSRRSLFYCLPVLFLAAFSGAVHFEWWHVGLLMPLVICLLWITWPAPGSRVSWPEGIGRIALVVIAIVQISWSGYAIRFDHYNAYSPDLATAEFLQPFVRQGATIAVTYLDNPDGGVNPSPGALLYRSIGILPYFDHNIFINLPDSFWSWSNQNPTEKMFEQAFPSHPDLVVVEMPTPHPDSHVNALDPKAELLSRDGYRLTHMFCGAMPLGSRLEQRSCHLIFQRSGSPR
jgi:hypothetical protein